MIFSKEGCHLHFLLLKLENVLHLILEKEDDVDIFVTRKSLLQMTMLLVILTM